MTEYEIVTNYLNYVTKMIPNMVYWLDQDFRFLGINQAGVVSNGISNIEFFIGKTVQDIYPSHIAKQLLSDFREVVLERREIQREHLLEDVLTGEQKYFVANIAPLYDICGEKCLGVFVSAIDITDEKKMEKLSEQEKIFNYLDSITNTIPTVVYWMDSNGRLAGINDLCLTAVSIPNKECVLGKTFYEIFQDREIADNLQKDIDEILKSGKVSKVEDKIIDIGTGEYKYYMATRAPIRDSKGNIIGVLGTSIDITAEKKIELLKLENQAQLEKKYEIVQQVFHDIRSPITTMQMVLPNCEIYPENARITLNQSASRIQDIANQLLNRFHSTNNDENNTSEAKRSPELISTSILEIISEKRFEYGHLPVEFVANITTNGYFVFANIDLYGFKRMLSNLINNSVEALNGRYGVVSIGLDVVNNKVKIVIEDNGCGMSKLTKKKILNNVLVTAGKKHGYGIGFVQIRDTLNNNQGELEIASEIGIGTKIILTFPQIKKPNWIVDQIELKKIDTIIILDDDPSIHGAWDTRFDKILPEVKRKHFEKGIEAVTFINTLSDSQKKNIFLLTDYELLKEEINGLDVIAMTKLNKSILVTSHYNNENIRSRVQKSKIKILPKLLAAEVPIVIKENKSKQSKKQNNNVLDKLKKVDLVFIDDDKVLVDTFINYVLVGKKIDVYNCGIKFLKSAKNYDLNTKFLIDMQLGSDQINGITIAKNLYELGFKGLYLFSGLDLENDDSVPYYANIIAKTDIDAVANLVGIKIYY